MQLAEAMVEEKEAENGPVILLTALINTLQEDAGFHFIKVKEPAIGSVCTYVCMWLYMHLCLYYVCVHVYQTAR